VEGCCACKNTRKGKRPRKGREFLTEEVHFPRRGGDSPGAEKNVKGWGTGKKGSGGGKETVKEAAVVIGRTV